MSAAWVQGGTAAASAVTSYTFTFPSNVVAGDSLFGNVYLQNNQPTNDVTVTDGVNGAWTADNPNTANGTDSSEHAPFRVFNAGGGATTVTLARVSGGTGNIWSACSFVEVSGLGPSPTVNVTGTASGNDAAPTTASFTPAPGDFVFVGYGVEASNTTATPNSGWLDGSDATHHELLSPNPNNNTLGEDAEYQLSASGSAITGGFTVPTGGLWVIAWASYTPTVVAGPSQFPHRAPRA